MTGEILKRRREDLQLNLKEIASLLKVRADYLEAIENNVFDRLPVEVYTKGYIRCYAQYLNVDAEPIISYYKEHLAKPQHATIIPVASSKKKSPVPLFVSIILAAGIVVAVFLWRSEQGTVRQTLPEKTIPQTAVSPVPAPVPENAAAPEKVPEQMPVQSLPSAASPASPEKKQEHALEFRAIETTWIYLKPKSNSPEEVLLQPGDSKVWKFSEQVFVKLGNAGGVRVNFDGKDLNLGAKSGEVLTLLFPQNE